MKIPSSLLTLAVLLPTALQADPEPYDSVRAVPYEPYFLEDSWYVQNLAITHNAQVIVDVGSHDGAASRDLVNVLPPLPEGKLYAIHSWFYDKAHPEHHYTYHKFLSNVKLDGHADRIIPIRMLPSEAAEALNIVADLIYIAASDKCIHKSIIDWFPHLTETGIIVGNNWSWHPVQIGVTQAADELDLTLHVENNTWWLERPVN
jgi:hypothetical protein